MNRFRQSSDKDITANSVRADLPVTVPDAITFDIGNADPTVSLLLTRLVRIFALSANRQAFSNIEPSNGTDRPRYSPNMPSVASVFRTQSNEEVYKRVVAAIRHTHEGCEEEGQGTHAPRRQGSGGYRSDKVDAMCAQRRLAKMNLHKNIIYTS